MVPIAIQTGATFLRGVLTRAALVVLLFVARVVTDDSAVRSPTEVGETESDTRPDCFQQQALTDDTTPDFHHDEVAGSSRYPPYDGDEQHHYD